MNKRIIPILNVIIILLCGVILCGCNISAFSISADAAESSDVYSLRVYFNPNNGTITSDAYKLKNEVIFSKDNNIKYEQLWTLGKTKANGLTNASSFGLTRTGYTFAGWGTSPSGGTIFNQNDSSLKAENINANVKNGNCSITLYAIWQKNTLKISYNANEGSVISDTYKLNDGIICKTSNNTQYVQNWIYNTAKKGGLVNSGSFGLTRTGYTFSGWGTSAKGGTVFDHTDETLTAEQIYPSIKNKNCTLTLFAIWTLNTIDVSFNANGGSIKSKTYELKDNIIYKSSDSTKYVQSWSYGSTKPNGLSNYSTFGLTRTGYTFLGWGTKPTGGTVFDQNDSTLTAEQINSTVNRKKCSSTLYAIWGKNEYTIIYDANGGNGTVKSSVHTYGTAKALNTNMFTRTGYTFAGWSTSASASTPTYTDKQSVKNLTNKADCTVTLYAVWKPIQYSVKYNANGGTGTMTNSDYTFGKVKALRANKFTKTGYTFVGWSRSPSATDATYADKQKVSVLTGVNGKTVNLYAIWKINTYTVEYNSNGGTGKMSRSEHTYNSAKKLNANTFTRTGYKFLGWSTSAGAKTATFTDNQYVKNLTGKNNGSVILYAVWKPITYSVKYNANGGKGTMSDSAHTFGTAKALSANKFTRTGYTFLGWSKTKNATTATYKNKQAVSGLTGVNGKVVNLFAVWQKK